MIHTTATIKTENSKHKIKVSDNFLTRAWGLSLKKEGKMLFKFPRNTRAGIDMMLLSRPLYLYFANQEKEIIHKEKAEPWTWNPKTWKTYRPRKKYKYLIESFEPLELEKGDRFQILND